MASWTHRLLAGITLSLSLAALVAAPDVSAPAAAERVAPAASGPYVTILFSLTEMTAADDCVRDDRGIARLDTVVAPYLQSMSMTATGTLVTGKTSPTAMACSHWNSSLSATWPQATQLARTYGWSFVSHTATYPKDLSALTPAQSQAETCGSAQTIDQHGLRGGHGMIAYPGAQASPVTLQTRYGSHCFAWGREYGSLGITLPSAGTTAPYWQHTYAANGGACNDTTAACYTIPSTGSPHYRLPANLIKSVTTVAKGQWLTLQAYILVRGRSPAYSSSTIRWDCTASDPRLHWTNDNERYCYQDFQAVVRAIKAKAGVVVTDPLTVGVAFGRPATYPPTAATS